MNARMLPRYSIVAGESRVWIKRSNEDRHPKGTPFHETWWIEATSYSIAIDDREIQRLLNEGAVQVLRVGATGSSASGDTAPYPTEEADRGDAQYRAFGDSDRAHVDLCGRGPADPCFEDDFTEECSCWCHGRNQAALVTGSSASGDTAPKPPEVKP